MQSLRSYCKYERRTYSRIKKSGVWFNGNREVKRGKEIKVSDKIFG